MVSFVVTYHNETMALLQACLESIRLLPMAKGEAEVIVVDDGMTLSDSLLAEGERLIQQEQAAYTPDLYANDAAEVKAAYFLTFDAR